VLIHVWLAILAPAMEFVKPSTTEHLVLVHLVCLEILSSTVTKVSGAIKSVRCTVLLPVLSWSISTYHGRIIVNTVKDQFLLLSELSPLPRPECESDGDCGDHQSCINQRCQNPCSVGNPCGSGANCRTQQHRPTCQCPDGWGGNPQIQCYRRKYIV